MKASARIQVILDVPIGETWHAHDSLGDVRLQAVAAGVTKLSAIFEREGIAVVGEPTVTIVLVEDV